MRRRRHCGSSVPAGSAGIDRRGGREKKGNLRLYSVLFVFVEVRVWLSLSLSLSPPSLSHGPHEVFSVRGTCKSTDATAHLGAEATDADYRGGWPFVSSTLWKGFPTLLISGISNLIPHCLSSKQAWTFSPSFALFYVLETVETMKAKPLIFRNCKCIYFRIRRLFPCKTYRQTLSDGGNLEGKEKAVQYSRRSGGRKEKRIHRSIK